MTGPRYGLRADRSCLSFIVLLAWLSPPELDKNSLMTTKRGVLWKMEDAPFSWTVQRAVAAAAGAGFPGKGDPRLGRRLFCRSLWFGVTVTRTVLMFCLCHLAICHPRGIGHPRSFYYLSGRARRLVRRKAQDTLRILEPGEGGCGGSFECPCQCPAGPQGCAGCT